MIGKKLFRSASLMAGALLFYGTTVCAEYALEVKTDKPEALYSTGEKIIFSIELKSDGKPVPGKTVSYSIARDGSTSVNGSVVTADNPVTVETVMDNPGFALLNASFTDENKKNITALGGAGADPLKIKAGLECEKDDFDKFWSAKKEELNKLPLEVKMEPVPVPSAALKGKVECFDIKVNCPGEKPVSGYFARPVNAAKGSLPAIVTYHGAGVYNSSLGTACNWAAKGMIALDINAHGIENGKPQEFYKDLGSKALNGYAYFGKNDREKCYFLGMFQRVYRSLQFIKSQPEWDGKCLVTRGSSQGGGQSIAAAGLDPQVSFCAAFVPAICDHYGYLAKRQNGWPKLISSGKDGKYDENVVATAKYFDGVNFAARIKGDAIFSVGFIDRTCCPSAVYAAYNNIPGKKEIVNNPLFGHSNPPSAGKAVDDAIMAHVNKMKAGK